MSTKVTPEELKELQDVRKAVYETISILGDLNYRKTLINLELESIKEIVKEKTNYNTMQMVANQKAQERIAAMQQQ